jgi:hypothetical protein
MNCTRPDPESLILEQYREHAPSNLETCATKLNGWIIHYRNHGLSAPPSVPGARYSAMLRYNISIAQGSITTELLQLCELSHRDRELLMTCGETSP